MFKKIFITLFVLIILALGGASYYVSTIDWNNYKNKITAQLEDVTGKKIVINGKIDLTFFPKPHLSATNIKIYNSNTNPKIANTPLGEIKEMVADLSLMPLLKRQFVIDKMNLTNANILVEFLEDGKTNWYSPIDAEQGLNLAGVDIAFNSIMLQDSVVRIVNNTLNFDASFHKVNADISAQSLVGPFRIDGNLMKDNTPAGFALNIGTLSESFSTSLNLVLTHPSSESYARFDGSVLSNNSEIKGNFTVESQKPSVFVNTISGQNLLAEKYNYPVAASIDLSVNPRQADLSSFVVKYGDNLAGSGRVLVPLEENDGEKKKIEASFEMTDLDLMPFVSVLQEYLKHLEKTKTPYAPSFEYDIDADISATRALLYDETIRNFKLTADIDGNVIKIKNLSALLIGDTDVSIKGGIFENEKRLSYELKVQALSQDFLKFLQWLKIEPKTYAPSTYRNARAAFDVSGNLSEIKFSPFEFGVDKIETSGVIGIKRDRRNALFINLKSENINFDNYAAQNDENTQKTSFANRAKDFLRQFKFLNNMDVEADLALGVGIYHKVPFENTILKFSAKDGVVALKQLEINPLASAKLNVLGTLSNFGANPSFENLKYKLETSDFKTFNQKLALNLPDWPLFKNARNVTFEGISSGSFDSLNTKSIANIGKNAFSYAGRVSERDGKADFKGKLKIKAADFVEFVNSMNIEYSPKNLASAVMTFDADVEGMFGNWRAENADAFVGTNHFTGNFAYAWQTNRPKITADVSANLFEFDRFVFAPAQNKSLQIKKAPDAFIEQPRFDSTHIDYSAFQNFDLEGNFKIKNLSYLNSDIENVSFLLDVDNGKITLKDFVADKKPAVFKVNFVLDTNNEPKIEGTFNAQNVSLGKLGGSVYELEDSKAMIQSTYKASAASFADFVKTLSGAVKLQLDDAILKGINLPAIVDNLKNRTHSDGLEDFLANNLKSGQTTFETIVADADLENGRYGFKNALMQASLGNIDISGAGSLETWKFEANATIQSEELSSDLPSVGFAFEGMLANPVLSVDAKALKEHYDTHWEELERQEKEQKEAAQKALKERMDNAEAIVEKQINFLNSEVFPRLKRYKLSKSYVQATNVYESVDIEANDILKTLKQLAAKAYRTYNDDDIEKINIQTSVFAPTLPELTARLDEAYLTDLKWHISSDAKAISDLYQNTKEKSVNYQNTLNSYTMRLMQIGSLVVLDQMDTVKINKAKIERAIRNISEFNRQSVDLTNKAFEMTSIAPLDAQYQQMQKLYQSTVAEFENLNTALEDLFLYVQDVVYFEQTGKHKTPEPKVQQANTETPPVEQAPEPTVEAKPQVEDLPVLDKETKVEEEIKEVQTPEVIETQTVTEEPKAHTDIAPQANGAPEIKTDKVPTKFVVQTTPEVQPVVEEGEKTERQEPAREEVLPVQEEIIETPKAEKRTLLVEQNDDYMSKTLISGSVTRKGARTNTATQSVSQGKSLLRPIEGEVLIEGGVKRK